METSHPGCIMVGSLKHHRFGLFGTERTGAGIIIHGQFDRSPPTTGYGGSRSGNLGGGGGGGPDWNKPFRRFSRSGHQSELLSGRVVTAPRLSTLVRGWRSPINAPPLRDFSHPLGAERNPGHLLGGVQGVGHRIGDGRPHRGDSSLPRPFNA